MCWKLVLNSPAKVFEYFVFVFFPSRSRTLPLGNMHVSVFLFFNNLNEYFLRKNYLTILKPIYIKILETKQLLKIYIFLLHTNYNIYFQDL